MRCYSHSVHPIRIELLSCIGYRKPTSDTAKVHKFREAALASDHASCSNPLASVALAEQHIAVSDSLRNHTGTGERLTVSWVQACGPFTSSILWSGRPCSGLPCLEERYVIYSS